MNTATVRRGYSAPVCDGNHRSLRCLMRQVELAPPMASVTLEMFRRIDPATTIAALKSLLPPVLDAVGQEAFVTNDARVRERAWHTFG
jgi:hypothetical protein